jgi:ribosome-binding factor A
MKNTGDGRRKIRIEKEVQEIVSRFIIKHLRSDLPGLITITRVQMPADFRAAQIFVTYFSPEEMPGQNLDVAEVLQGWAKDIQDEIAHVLKMRYCPKLTFFNDETTEKILKIEKTLADIAKNPAIIKQVDEDID